MPTFTVRAAGEKKRFQGKQGGEFTVFNVDVVDEQGNGTMAAELVQKSDSPPPQAGDTIQGTLEDTSYGWKLKKEYVGKGGGFGPRPEDPKRSRAILRQHSQHMALLYMQATGNKPESWDEFFRMVDKFDQDVEDVRNAVVGG